MSQSSLPAVGLSHHRSAAEPRCGWEVPRALHHGFSCLPPCFAPQKKPGALLAVALGSVTPLQGSGQAALAAAHLILSPPHLIHAPLPVSSAPL